MRLLRAIAVFLCGVYSLRLSNAQIVKLGKCPVVKTKTGFDFEQLNGKWYGVEIYSFPFEHNVKCITTDYTLKDNGAIGVTIKQIKTLSGVISEIQGEANPVGKSDEGKLSVRFPSLPVNNAARNWVLDTDYNTYLFMWNCTKRGIFFSPEARLFTRQRIPPQSVLDKVYAAVDRSRINRDLFIKIDQYNCPDLDN